MSKIIKLIEVENAIVVAGSWRVEELRSCYSKDIHFQSHEVDTF